MTWTHVLQACTGRHGCRVFLSPQGWRRPASKDTWGPPEPAPLSPRSRKRTLTSQPVLSGHPLPALPPTRPRSYRNSACPWGARVACGANACVSLEMQGLFTSQAGSRAESPSSGTATWQTGQGWALGHRAELPSNLCGVGGPERVATRLTWSPILMLAPSWF